MVTPSGLETCRVRVELPGRLPSPCPAPLGGSRSRVADKSRKSWFPEIKTTVFRKSHRGVYFLRMPENMEMEGIRKAVGWCQAALDL